MATVRFTDPGEFIEELNKEKGNFKLVRLTNLLTPMTGLPQIRALQVVATVQIEPNIIRLEKFCGQIWDLETRDQAIYEKARGIQNQIDQACQELKVEVRAGIIEERER